MHNMQPKLIQKKNCGFINTFNVKQGRMKINKLSSEWEKNIN